MKGKAKAKAMGGKGRSEGLYVGGTWKGKKTMSSIRSFLSLHASCASLKVPCHFST